MQLSQLGQISLPLRHMLASSGPQLPCDDDQPSTEKKTCRPVALRARPMASYRAREAKPGL